jgi:hypothetical protein
MAQFDLNRAGETPISTLKLNEVAAVNWRRYPGKVMTVAMVTPVYVPTVSYTGGAANEGAASDNTGEHGTANATGDTTIAVDVGKSYHGTRGAIEPHERYPSTDTSETPAAFRSSNYIIPGTP